MIRNKLNFLNLPTPLDYLENISKDLKVDIYLKRDDLTGIGLGGNKLRKLEYLIKDALDKGASRIITVGGIQTNHGRLTASVCAKYNLKSTIISIDNYPGEVSSNILLSRIFNSEVIVKKSDGRDMELQFNELVDEYKNKYEKMGEKVYYIPLGGSNEIGFLGYYDCGLELLEDFNKKSIKNPHILVTVGSCGTYLGLLGALKENESKVPLTGIAISNFDDNKLNNIFNMYKLAKERYSLKYNLEKKDIDIRKEYVGKGYNKESQEVREAIYYMARKEGIILDPCYTGKTFSGILDLIKMGEFKGETIVFIHTGGYPGLYTKEHRVKFESELIDGISILE